VLARLEQVRGLPDRFRGGVAGHRRECGIHVLDLSREIGDDDGVSGLLDGRDQPGSLDVPASS